MRVEGSRSGWWGVWRKEANPLGDSPPKSRAGSQLTPATRPGPRGYALGEASNLLPPGGLISKDGPTLILDP